MASPANFGAVTGLEVAGGWLYVAYSDNTLWRMPIDTSGHADVLHRALVDNGAVSGRQWATLDFSFVPAPGTGFEPPPPAPPVCSGATPILARYYLGTDPVGFAAAERCEASGVHNFGSASPDPAVPADGFSARWTQTVSLAAASNVTFSIDTDDGARLFLDGDKILDAWKVQSTTHYEVTVPVGAGDHTFEVQYYENTGNATANFAYQVLGAIPVPPTAAVVTPDPTSPASGDVLLRDHLVAAGYDVTYVDDDTVDDASAAAFDVVWIGGNIDSSALLNRLKDTARPIVVQKSRLLDMMSLAKKTTTVLSSTMTIVAPGHPLAAGRTGTVTVLDAAKAMVTAQPTASAVNVADPASAAYFVLAPGATRTDGTPAPACRVSFPVEYNGLSRLTPDGLALLDATIASLAGPDCAP